jgi:hypothetical protein
MTGPFGDVVWQSDYSDSVARVVSLVFLSLVLSTRNPQLLPGRALGHVLCATIHTEQRGRMQWTMCYKAIPGYLASHI